MKVFEKILIIIFCIGLLLKIGGIPGGSVLCILMAMIASLFYMLFGAFLLNDVKFRQIFDKDAYTEIDTGKLIIGATTGFIGLSVLTLGILFKIQSYPGAQIMLIVGIGGGFITLIPTLITKKKWAIVRLVAYLIVALIIFFIPKSEFDKVKTPNIKPPYETEMYK